MGKITIKDIAKALHVSTSTVSRALNDSHEVGIETKKKILAFAKQHRYQANPYAKTLKLGKTNNIGVIIPFIDSPFFTQFLEGLFEAIAPYQFNIILKQSNNTETAEKKAIEELLQQDISALIISPSREHSNIDLLQGLLQNIPIIIFDRISHHLETYKIGIDSFKDTYTATKQLIKNNRSRIAILCNNDIGANVSRIQGYYKALDQYRIPRKDDYEIYTDYQHPNQDVEEILIQKIELLRQNKKMPDAIISTTDTLSVRVLSALRKLKIQVPKDIAVIGFANTHMAASLNPPLSTIQQPARQIAETAIQILVKALKRHHIDPPHSYEKVFLPSIITLRDSTKKTK